MLCQSKEDMEANGLKVAETATIDSQVEAFECDNHCWGIGVQYHPEFISKPTKPHPLFSAFIGATINAKKGK